MSTSETTPTSPWSLTHIDLLSERYGGQVLDCNDEFFAQASNLLKRSEPVFIEDKYTDRGKWMDGWETRRRRSEGHDWCLLQLGIPGRICAIDVDTRFFKGNAPSHIAIDACCCNEPTPNSNTVWQTLVAKSPVRPHSRNNFAPESSVTGTDNWTHLRLNIFPDGGVARLRIYGEPQVDWSSLLPNELVDLAACANGGRAIACSDMFFSPMNNLLAPGRGINMGDGWETRRRRGAGNDWVIIKLASPGKLGRVVVDTCHFKGNYPERISLEGTMSDREDLSAEDIPWTPVIAGTPVQAHREHVFQRELLATEALFSHVRLNIFPDGGVSRLRVFAYPDTGHKAAQS
ncbi:allantoicase [Zhongshania sp.]|uniref:allantoicase n=1 Tax=Zhongshania sp. TaxID=1971902 RepID=UPI003562EE0E